MRPSLLLWFSTALLAAMQPAEPATIMDDTSQNAVAMFDKLQNIGDLEKSARILQSFVYFMSIRCLRTGDAVMFFGRECNTWTGMGTRSDITEPHDGIEASLSFDSDLREETVTLTYLPIIYQSGKLVANNIEICKEDVARPGSFNDEADDHYPFFVEGVKKMDPNDNKKIQFHGPTLTITLQGNTLSSVPAMGGYISGAALDERIEITTAVNTLLEMMLIIVKQKIQNAVTVVPEKGPIPLVKPGKPFLVIDRDSENFTVQPCDDDAKYSFPTIAIRRDFRSHTMRLTKMDIVWDFLQTKFKVKPKGYPDGVIQCLHGMTGPCYRVQLRSDGIDVVVVKQSPLYVPATPRTTTSTGLGLTSSSSSMPTSSAVESARVGVYVVIMAFVAYITL